MTEVSNRRRCDNGRPRYGREATTPDTANNGGGNNDRPPGFTVTRPTSMKKVQVVYYLSRNGHLEHPHYMEVSHLSTRHLLLKDVMDRLTVLRGKGMPSLYSWSCKRSYKNGYVWNDLAENDAIYPCEEGAEYILKGSELLQSSSEKLSNSQPIQDEGDVLPKRRPMASKRHPKPEEAHNSYEDHGGEEECEEKISYTSCPRAEENRLCVREKDKNSESNRTELPRTDSSPPSSASSLSEKGNDASKRFEDGDPVAADSLLSRNSVLFQLISCGGSASFRAKNLASFAKPPPTSVAVGRKSCSGSGSSLQKEILIRAAATSSMEDEEEIIIKYMSENPRFGNMQSEEKEYFSGSIVESIAAEEKDQICPSLKKSNSYNEERSCKAGIGGESGEKEVKKRGKSEKAGKCIPMKKSSSKQSSKK